MEINSSVSRETIAKMLADPDDISGVLGSLQFLGRRGDNGGATLGCADLVAACTRRSETKVVAAAIECLGQLGQEGAQFHDECAAGLRHGDESVRLSAAQALGFFGTSARGSAPELARLLDEDTDDVRAAAIHSLGLMNAQGQADKIAKHLDSKSLSVVAAACMALGNLGEAGSNKADDIARKLDDVSIRFAALSGLVSMGSSVVAKHADAIISKCLVDRDYPCRQAAVVAMAKSAESLGDRQIDQILALMKHEDPGVRCAACFAIGGLREKGKPHAAAVANILKQDNGEDSNLALEMGGTHRVPPVFRKVRVAALSTLGVLEAGNFAAECADHFADNSWEVRSAAVEAVGHFGDDGSAISSHVAELLEDDVYLVRARACETLGLLKADQHTDKLLELFGDKAPSVRAHAVTAVGMMGEESASHSTAVFKMLSDDVNQVRAAACAALASMGETGQSYAGVIARCLNDTDPYLRAAAIEALGKLGAHGAAFADEIGACLKDDTSEVRDAATRALEGMSGEPRHGEEE